MLHDGHRRPLTSRRPPAPGSRQHWLCLDTPPAATERNPLLPAQVDAVLARALHKDPDERYACAGDFVAGLWGALATGGERVSTRARRSWLASAGAALLAG